ncbi:MAG TPA: vWA domain-containing protein [Nannocystaceae bacterium]|nr:vWA domain-containing protein [Nannocystaceae bacterium]
MRVCAARAAVLGIAGVLSGCADRHDAAGDSSSSAGSDDGIHDVRDRADCIAIDRIYAGSVAPSGVQVRFRVLGCDGEPVPRIATDRIHVTNLETGGPFEPEGGATALPGAPAASELYTVLVLDMSSSIFEAGAEDDVLAAAAKFIERHVETAPPGYVRKVAIIQLGRTSQVRLVRSFTADVQLLYASLEALAAGGPLGSTDLYGAYLLGLETLARAGSTELVERSMLLVTDGVHEAGDTEELRAEALAAKDASDARIFTLGIRGDYDTTRLIELASTPTSFISITAIDELLATFERVGERLQALADSNYVVGVCTPVSRGGPHLRVDVELDSAAADFTVAYQPYGLVGDTLGCEPAEVAGLVLACNQFSVCHAVCESQTCGSEDGVDCGDCSAAEYCDPQRLSCRPSYRGPGPECTATTLVRPNGDTCEQASCDDAIGGACTIACDTIDDCPPVPSEYLWLTRACLGDEHGTCMLECDAGEICPAEARCVAVDGRSLCLW